jgi:hypothetical protein
MGTAWHVWITAARQGKGTAWARHGMCELGLTLCGELYKLITWTRNSGIPNQARFSHTFSTYLTAKRAYYIIMLNYPKRTATYSTYNYIALRTNSVHPTSGYCPFRYNHSHYLQLYRIKVTLQRSDFAVKHVGLEWKLLSWLSGVGLFGRMPITV